MSNLISSYRLGDLVCLSLTNNELKELLNENPNSIGAKFINELSINPFLNKFDLITFIVINELNNKSNLLPNDIKQSTVIHLRLGDVIAGNNSHELIKRPYTIEELKKVIPPYNKNYIITKNFFAKTSSKNYDECIQKSNEYLNEVITTFNGIKLNNDDADMDLLCAVQAKHFVQGKGYFSQLIYEIRKRIYKN
jgi:hypothetical protein